MIYFHLKLICFVLKRHYAIINLKFNDIGMMLMINRHAKILDLVNTNKKIEVTKLSDELNTSQVTIRKDLDMLERKGLLKREHGFAVMVASDDINNHLAFNYNLKREIAIKAAELVNSGDTIIIESGASCALLAEEIALRKYDVTIITNSAFIASFIRKAPFVKIVLLGGDYQKESQVVVGPMVKKCIENFYVDKIFVGTDGFNEKIGFTGNNHMRVEALKSMAQQANKIIILTESSKFLQQGVVAQFKTNEVDYVFTDNKIPEETLKFLQAEHVHVQTVSVDA
ncbi:MAG: transcriptional regulator of sugar metabolism [Firmicutes bacterium]|nr:transcriptional regulator of sugar metabolism [Bacillota bacterium]